MGREPIGTLARRRRSRYPSRLVSRKNGGAGSSPDAPRDGAEAARDPLHAGERRSPATECTITSSPCAIRSQPGRLDGEVIILAEALVPLPGPSTSSLMELAASG